MDSPDFVRSHALNNIPNKKLQDKISFVQDGTDTQNIKVVKLQAINRYAESNIPIEYWNLKMERDFTGDARLKQKYDEYVADIKKSYMAGNSLCLAGAHGLGKQLSLDTELPTPSGFIKLIDLKEGDQLFDENGEICTVIKLHPINLSPESYKIIFDDGTEVEACADHQWLTYTRSNMVYGSLPTVKSTKEILETLKFKNGKTSGSNHSIPCSKPLKYPTQNLPIDPYLFGLWLGDGDKYNGLIESANIDIFKDYQHHITPSSKSNHSKSVTIRVDGLYSALRKLGFIRRKKLNIALEKHIPDIYLRSSYEQRLALLQGLMDTDGCCLTSGMCEFTTIIPKLADQFAELVRSLGIKCNVNRNESWLYDKKCSDRYRITFTTQLSVFKMQRKLDNIRSDKQQLNRAQHRYIVDIKPIESKSMRCITVDSSSHLFLITRAFIATHNTMTATCILKGAVHIGYSCLYTTLSDIVSVLTQGNSEDKFLSRRELVLVDFLVIDEFDPRFMATENAADLYARTLESVFRTRSSNKLPTLMCTNSPNVVESFSGPLRASIDSLMKGYLKVFPVLGEDFRKKGSK